MAAIALPDLDRQKLDRIRDRLTPLTAIDLPDFELPDLDLSGLEQAGRRAEGTIDRLTGRSRPSIWPRLAVGLGLLALVGLAIVVLGSSRRGAWGTTELDDLEYDVDRPFDGPQADLAATTLTEPLGPAGTDPGAAGSATSGAASGATSGATAGGLTAAEASLMTTDPAEEEV